MTAGLQISDYGKALLCVEEEIERIDQQLVLLAARKAALQASANKILSEVKQVANVQTYCHNGGDYGLRRMGRPSLRVAA